MVLLLRILSIPVLVIGSVFSVIVGLGITSEGKLLFKPYLDTHMSKDYSPEKFDLIKVNMSKQEASNLLGEPLYKQINDDSTQVIFHFTGDGKLLSLQRQRGNHSNSYKDLAWYRSSFVLDSEKDIIINIDKGWSYD